MGKNNKPAAKTANNAPTTDEAAVSTETEKAPHPFAGRNIDDFVKIRDILALFPKVKLPAENGGAPEK